MLDLTYDEAIEQIMLKNGGFASLKQLYNDIWLFKDKKKINGKTPNNTIQERVQRSKKFFRLGLGVYGLNDLKDKIFLKEVEPKTAEQKIERIHAKIQGMLIELGNIDGFDTYTNDKSWTFEGKLLGSLTSIKSVPNFTYEEIIKRNVAFCDVVWFSSVGSEKFLYPKRICEVEHSTDFRDALLKFKELEFFNSEFFCISDISRKDKFLKELSRSAFKSLQGRVKFFAYDEIIATYEYKRKGIKF